MPKSSTMIVSRKVEQSSQHALRLFAVSLLMFSLGAAICLGCIKVFGRLPVKNTFVFPKAFLLSTALLAVGSLAMHKAVLFVKVEKQQPFRKWLLIALVTGVVFTGVQSYGLWSIFPTERSTDEAVLGVAGFVIALSTLHAIHFCVAEIFLTYVVIRTWADRYDHEYYWGVKVCAWIWHFLGIVWVAILAVIAIVL